MSDAAKPKKIAWNRGLVGMNHRSLAVRFWEKVDRRTAEECWPWIGAVNAFGRGKLSVGGKLMYAPRIAWTLYHRKPWPDGLDACHSCDNPNCVNPLHVWPGTESENLKDAVAKGRFRKGVRPLRKTIPQEEVLGYAREYQAGTPIFRLAKTHDLSYSRMRRLVYRAIGRRDLGINSPRNAHRSGS